MRAWIEVESDRMTFARVLREEPARPPREDVERLVVDLPGVPDGTRLHAYLGSPGDEGAGRSVRVGDQDLIVTADPALHGGRTVPLSRRWSEI